MVVLFEALRGKGAGDPVAVGEAGETLRRGSTGLAGHEAKADDAEDGATRRVMLAQEGAR